ncbi:hypothetical protein ACI8AF_23685 [Blastococcus sp. SYSU D00669]
MIRFDLDTGAVTGLEPGAGLSPAGRPRADPDLFVVFGSDGDDGPPWVEFRSADGAVVAPRLPPAATGAEFGAVVLAELLGAVRPGGPVAAEASGWVHALTDDDLVPFVVPTDLATGESAVSGPVCPGHGTLERLVLTSAGAVVVGTCEGPNETGLWLVRPRS